jgi:N-acetylmuramoyl-L-alanine amidase
MRKTLGRTALLGLCVLVANAALAGNITKRGAAQPAMQTIFRIDAPAVSATVFGIVEVRGFVLDPRGVSRITLLIDGAPVHDADLNQPRDDVRLRYPRFQGEDFAVGPGFVTSFLASNYASGSHTLAIRVTYSNSDVAELGNQTVIVDNSLNQAPIGALDSPGDPNIYVSGVYPVTGWVIDAEGIRTTTAPDGKLLADIEVMVDDMVVGQAVYPLPRPDVANAHPDVATAFNSGFQMNLDTTRFTNGIHTISVRAWDTQGMSNVFGSMDVWLENNYGTLGPFGGINWPMSNGHFYSTGCFSANPPSGISYNPGDHVDWVSGWVVDQSDQTIFEGVVSVELLLNGSVVKNTSTDCGPVTMAPAVTYQSNCYGIERPDILYQYPQFAMDAKYSGFFFDVNTRYYLQAGQLHLGLNILGVQARTRDPLRPAVLFSEVPIIVDCDDRGLNPAYGELEVPVAMQKMENTQLVKGWVIDFPGGVKQLNFYVDGVLDGSLVAPRDRINLLRSDIPLKYPWLPYPDSLYSGFEYSLATQKYVDGIHQLVVEAIGYNGRSNYWVQRPVVFDNPN